MEEILERIREAEKAAAEIVSEAEKAAGDKVRREREKVLENLENEKKRNRIIEEERYSAEIGKTRENIEKQKKEILVQKEVLLNNKKLTGEATDLTASALLKD